MTVSGLGSAARAGEARASAARATSAMVVRKRNPAHAFSRDVISVSIKRRAGGRLFCRLAMPEPRVQLADELFGRVGDYGAGREVRFRTGRVERVVILRRHHAADDDHDVVATLL